MPYNDSFNTMPETSNLEVELIRLLEEMSNCADDLEMLLKSECAAVKTRDINALKRFTDRKHQLVSALEALETNRKSLVQAYGYAIDHQGMTDCLTDLDAHDRLTSIWQRLLTSLDHCHYQNRVNGSLLIQSHRAVEGVLHVLQGGFPEDRLYNPEGYETIRRGYRSIAKF